MEEIGGTTHEDVGKDYLFKLSKERIMEKIEVKSFYIYKDGGYKLTGRWCGRKIDFEIHPGDSPELLIDGGAQVADLQDIPYKRDISWRWIDLITIFPNSEWDYGDENDQAYRRFSAIQKCADDIATFIANTDEPNPY